MSSIQNQHITASQIRAARSIINWSQDELASICKLSIATIRKLELGHVSPRQSTNDVVRHALEEAGLEFIAPDGVRRRPEDIRLYFGRAGLIEFLDGVYESSNRKDSEILLTCMSETPFVKVLGLQVAASHIERMNKIRTKISHKCLLTEKPPPKFECSSYCSYRYLSKNYVDSVPFYVYADRYALILFDAIESPKIIEIKSLLVANSFRRQFYSMWDKANVLWEAK